MIPETPAVTSGIRVGTPATTTQGMGLPEMSEIANLIARAIKEGDDDAKANSIRQGGLRLDREVPGLPTVMREYFTYLFYRCSFNLYVNSARTQLCIETKCGCKGA